MRTASAARKDRIIDALVVDDHPVVRNGLCECLESCGRVRVVGQAGDGETAYRIYKQLRPDVVVLDLVMPGISGLEVIRRIRRFDPEARLLVFTAHDHAAYLERARQAGANGFLSKERELEDLVDGVLRVAEADPGQAWIGPEAGRRRRSSASGRRLEQLTLREFEVFRLLANGHSTAEVAKLLNISINTVGVHKTRIMHKLGVANSSQLTLFAIRNGVIKA